MLYSIFLCNTFLISEQRSCTSPQQTTSFQHLNESVAEVVEGGYDGAGAVLGSLHSGAAALLAHHGGRRRRKPRLLLLPSLPLRLLFPPSSLHPRRIEQQFFYRYPEVLLQTASQRYTCLFFSFFYVLSIKRKNSGMLTCTILTIESSSFFSSITWLQMAWHLDSISMDCMKHDPEVSEDLERSFTDLLSEELKLREAEAQENQQRADMALLEAKKMASQYQKEADKCNMGMETCEEAREKAEATLDIQRKLTAMWEFRARQRGWKGGPIKPRS
ncbi:hypothetical protein CK203_068662 [Vitis vinifera]|uniref:Uncharacterized protein n=1 Tax=Vitis vinifera TaxID=29760 RepID=A0A438EEC8_VITVI|nr:hypothetical protein CK203_068662 [Vitis vinifera]